MAGDGIGPSPGQRPRSMSAGSLSREQGSPGPQVTSARRGEQPGANGGPREAAQGHRRPPRRPEAPRVSGWPRAGVGAVTPGRNGPRSDGARPRPSRAPEHARSVARSARGRRRRSPATWPSRTPGPSNPGNPRTCNSPQAAPPQTRPVAAAWTGGGAAGRGGVPTGRRALAPGRACPSGSFRDARRAIASN